MKRLICLILTIALAFAVVSCGESNSSTPSTPTGDFDNSAAFKRVREMGVGINIGNTMDAWPGGDETAWECEKITPELFKAIKEKGFKTVRIPVTYYRTIGSAPNYTIKAEWLSRVREVVKMAADEGLFVITNMHHENDWLKTKSDNIESMCVEFRACWKQIATTLAEFDDKVMFECFNEVRDGDNWNGNDESYEVINRLHNIFVDVVRKTGGNNAKRFLILNTYAGSSATTDILGWKAPEREPNIIAEVHCYQPGDFCMSWGNGVYNSEVVQSNLTDIFNDLQTYFIDSGYPVIIGECGCINRNNLKERVEYTAFFSRLCKLNGICPIWWDNGLSGTDLRKENFGLINRKTYEWTFPELVDAFVNTKVE